MSTAEKTRLEECITEYRELQAHLEAKVSPWCKRNELDPTSFSRVTFALQDRVYRFESLVTQEKLPYDVAYEAISENVSKLKELSNIVGSLISDPAGLPFEQRVLLREKIQAELEVTRQIREASAPEPEEQKSDSGGFLLSLYTMLHKAHKTQPEEPEAKPAHLLECFVVPLIEIVVGHDVCAKGGLGQGRLPELPPYFVRGW